MKQTYTEDVKLTAGLYTLETICNAVMAHNLSVVPDDEIVHYVTMQHQDTPYHMLFAADGDIY